jgi:hypothetical protein
MENIQGGGGQAEEIVKHESLLTTNSLQVPVMDQAALLEEQAVAVPDQLTASASDGPSSTAGGASSGGPRGARVSSGAGGGVARWRSCS